jgi:hypothetical protein
MQELLPKIPISDTTLFWAYPNLLYAQGLVTGKKDCCFCDAGSPKKIVKKNADEAW